MHQRSVLRFVCLVLPLAAWMAVFGTATSLTARKSEGLKAGKLESLKAREPSQNKPEDFVGAAKCGECHAGIHKKWAGARHSKMLQLATPQTVLGDFSKGIVTLRGARFSLEQAGDRYVIRGPFPAGREEALRIDYTLGSRRVQHYLTTLADGRIVVLPPTWDVARREWFHNLDIVNPDEAPRNPVQVWNSNCFGCHVSAEVKGFDSARARYSTTWTDFGTNCERCHGPGAAHVARYASTPPTPGVSAIVVPTRLTTERSTMVCAQCHSLRDVTV